MKPNPSLVIMILRILKITYIIQATWKNDFAGKVEWPQKTGLTKGKKNKIKDQRVIKQKATT